MTGGILRYVVNVGARSMRAVNFVLQPLYLRLKNFVPIRLEAEWASGALWMHARKDRQCTYNVLLRRVCATIIEVEFQFVLHILSVCS
jgi:hypothetical protein